MTRREISELNADLYLPSRGPSPGIVLVLGALREGRRYPLLVTLARSIAACGYAVLVPELGRLRRLIVGEDALEDLIRAALALTDQDGVTQSPVGLFGFSLGGSLALVAAADDRLRDRVACVTSMGGYFSLHDMLTAATTGKLGASKKISLAAPSVYAIVASLIAGVPDPDRAFLERVLGEQQDSPLDAIARVDMGSVGLGAQGVLRLLMNRDPAAVASLTRNLEGVEAMLSRLSPEQVIDRINVPVWVLHDERDRFVPAHQSRLMREAAAGRSNFRFFGVRLLEHTEPDPPPFNPSRLFSDYLPGVIGLFRFVHGPLTAVRKSGSGLQSRGTGVARPATSPREPSNMMTMGLPVGRKPGTALPSRAEHAVVMRAAVTAVARIPHAKLILLSVYWVAIGYLWQGLHTLILPDLVLQFVGETYKGTALSMLENLGLLVATFWQPVAGAISDHTTTRWGRRRPFILGGTLLDIPFLIGIALSGSYWLLMVFYILLQASSNTAHGPYQALLPDVVPEKHRGEASGYYGIANMIGLLVGVVGVGVIYSRFGRFWAIASIAAVLLVAMAVTVLFVPDKTPPAPGRIPGPRRLLIDTFAEPVRNRNFMWITVCRLLVLMGLVGIQTYIFYFFYDTWFQGASSKTISATTTLIGLVIAITSVASLPAGMLSDHFGRRWLTVMSGALASIGIVGLVFSHYLWMPSTVLDPVAHLLQVPVGAAQAIVYGIPIGIGIGAFLSVNWAQMTDVIPQSRSAAYMGFFNIATAGSGVLTRLVGGGLLDYFNAHGVLFGLKAGYPVVFVFCALLTMAGGLVVLKTHETRQQQVPV